MSISGASSNNDLYNFCQLVRMKIHESSSSAFSLAGNNEMSMINTSA